MLGGVATGEVVLTAAFHEEHTYDAYTPNIQVSGGKLNGKKPACLYANIATRMLVIAKDENAKEGKDVALFIVDPKDASVKLTALKATTFEPQYIVEFNNTPAKKLGGADAVKYLVERYTAALCMYQAGAAEKMVQMTAAYTSEREQFNVKIASFQAVGHRVANCYIDAKCLKLVTQQAVELPLAQEADATRQVHAAKIWLGTRPIASATPRNTCTAAWVWIAITHSGAFALWAKQNELGARLQHPAPDR
ncbi:MAG: hypothetical protein IPK95_07075 [Cellvibrionales bacterium]|nr:hypothetical protein [Cellvibrionales bacterium]